jgi:SOS-response transcriptional repressor LexA
MQNKAMTLGQRIKSLMIDKGITLQSMGDTCGVSRGAVSNWHRTSKIDKYNLEKVAIRLGVNEKELLYGIPSESTAEGSTQGEPSNVRDVSKRPTVPLISSVRAGNWGEINDHEPDLSERIDCYESRPSRYAFALEIEGDSMENPNGNPSFPHGCIGIFDPEIEAKAGSYVVAKDVDTQQATFKRLMSDGGKWYLKPLNPAYPMMPIDANNKRIIGVLVEARVNLKF